MEGTPSRRWLRAVGDRAAAALPWHRSGTRSADRDPEPPRAGRDLPRGYYSPAPDVDQLTERDWSRRSPMHGIELALERQMEWAERELAPFVSELDAPFQPTGRANEFFLCNRYYEMGDAEVAYAMVRRFKPRRILELGSGHSTLVLARACLANASEGSPAELIAVDPYPEKDLAGAAGLSQQRSCRAQDVPLAEFESLLPGDVLFVDTSHTVKLGGEVNFVVLDVLPLLAQGVLVHFHDIWLPWEYHRTLVAEMGMAWNEQYLLQAFLSFNPHWEVLFAAQALARELPERFAALVPSFGGGNYPSAFWIRRTQRSSAPGG